MTPGSGKNADVSEVKQSAEERSVAREVAVA